MFSGTLQNNLDSNEIIANDLDSENKYENLNKMNQYTYILCIPLVALLYGEENL